MSNQNSQIVQAAAAVMNQLKGTFSILNERLDNLAKSIAIIQTLVEGHSKRIDTTQRYAEQLEANIGDLSHDFASVNKCFEVIQNDDDFSFDLKEKLLESDKFKDAVDSHVLKKVEQWPDFITRSISDAFSECQYGDRIDELTALLKQVQSDLETSTIVSDERFSEFEVKISSLPSHKDMEREIEDAIKQISEPKDGKDGKSVDRQEVLDSCIQMLKQHAEYQIKSLWEKAWTQKSDKLVDECKSVTAAIIDDAQKSIEGKIKTEIGKIQIHDGIDGVDGRDALELQIESEIDERRTYNRGAYAMHKGGLWRAFERTNKMRGWECVVAGISSVDMKFSDSRHFALDVKLSNGESTMKEFHVPTMLFKGAWKSGTVYEQGDVVQLDGLWYANCDTDKQPGVKNSDWILAVRRGQRGLPGDSIKVVKP